MDSVSDHARPQHFVTHQSPSQQSPHRKLYSRGPQANPHKVVSPQMTHPSSEFRSRSGSTASTASTLSTLSTLSAFSNVTEPTTPGYTHDSKGRGKDGVSKGRKGRAKALYFWNCDDVNKWLRKHCGQYHKDYGDVFREHDITGRSLVRLTDWKLQMMGIQDAQHREDLMRHVMRLKLKTEAQELKTLDQKPLAFERKN